MSILNIQFEYKLLKQNLKHNDNTVNIELLVKFYNKAIKQLERFINSLLDICNNILNWNIKYVCFGEIRLDNYNFPRTAELIVVIRMLKHNVIDLFVKSIYIANMYPKVDSVEIIEKKIIDGIKI